LALVVLVLAGFLTSVTSPAAAAGCSAPKGVYTGATPWPQKLVDAQRIWPLTTGSGVVVAIVGTGVDGANAQFAPGQVLPQIDLLPGGGPVPDCDGRGTFAAGIVGAQVNPNTTFAGVAPGVRLLSVRYTQSTSDAGQNGGDPNALATAISRAVTAGAGVILVVVPAASDSPALDAAVAQARNAGDVVVSPAVATQGGAVTYPTALAHVVGVGAVNSSGAAVQNESGDVAVAAPGADLVSTAAGAGGRLGLTWPVQDPTFAAAYVAGTVGLLRAYRPAMTPDQIENRLTLTAGRAAGGGRDARLGWGVLDAYAAVSSDLPADVAGPGAQGAVGEGKAVLPAPGRAVGRAPYWWAGVVALLGVLVAALVAFGAVTVRRGRARGWRLGR
jgi:hypothetical protein